MLLLPCRFFHLKFSSERQYQSNCKPLMEETVKSDQGFDRCPRQIFANHGKMRPLLENGQHYFTSIVARYVHHTWCTMATCCLSDIRYSPYLASKHISSLTLDTCVLCMCLSHPKIHKFGHNPLQQLSFRIQLYVSQQAVSICIVSETRYNVCAISI